MNKKNFKISLLGCGKVAEHYVKILDKNFFLNITIEAVCDRDKDKASNFAKKLNCKSFNDYNEMLKNISSDLICILTPSGSHYLDIKLALNRNFNVLVEKPITLIPSHADQLFKLSKKKKLHLVVAFQNRFNKAIQCIKEAIDKKRFGKIVTSAVVLRWCRYQNYYEDGWHGTWLNDGGVISQQGIHHVDALNWLIGPFKNICSFKTRRLNKLQAEDTHVSIIKLNDGSLSTIEATTAARPRDFEASISIIGEKGMAKVSGIALNEIVEWEFIKKEKSDKLIKKNYSQNFKSGYGLSHATLIEKVIHDIKNNKIDFVSLKKSVETTKIISSMYRSFEDKKIIRINSKKYSKKLGIK